MGQMYLQVDIIEGAATTTVTDVLDGTLGRAITDIISTGTLKFRNTNGQYKNVIKVGNTVKLYLDESNPPTTLVFQGLIRRVSFENPRGRKNTDYLVAEIADFGVRLQDVTANDIYTDQEVSVIIKDLVDKYVSGVTYTNVQTTTINLAKIRFKRKPVFDCIKQLAEIAQYDFYVDEDKDLHFEPKGTVDSGLVISDTTNLISSRFQTDTEDMANRVWVYGGQYLSGYKDSFTADGAGSTFTLQYKPYSASVTNAGVTQLGYVKGQTTTVESGAQYVVDFDAKQVIFLSVPTSGNSIVVNYDRGVPIIRRASDPFSIGSYGVKEKTIINKEIVDPNMARDIAKSEISLYGFPLSIGDVYIRGTTTATVGQLATVTVTNAGITNTKYRIIEMRYSLNPEALVTETHLNLKLANRIPTTEDLLKTLLSKIQQLQAAETDPTDTFQQMLLFQEGLGLSDTEIRISTRNLNDSFIPGSAFPSNNVVASGTNQVPVGDRRIADMSSGTGIQGIYNLNSKSPAIGSVVDGSGFDRTGSLIAGSYVSEGRVGVLRAGSFNCVRLYGTGTGGGGTSVGSAFEFSGGANLLSTVDSTALGCGSSDFTLEFWAITPQSGGGNFDRPVILWERPGQNNYARLEVVGGFGGTPVAGRPLFELNAGGTSYYCTGNTSPVGTDWKHWAGTRSGGYLWLHINGTLVGSKSILAGADPFAAGMSFYFGGNANFGFFSGTVDEVRLTSGALYGSANFTPENIEFTTDVATKALWHVNSISGAGSIALDSSANNLHISGNGAFALVTGSVGITTTTTVGAAVDVGNNFNFGSGNFTVHGWYKGGNTESGTLFGKSLQNNPGFGAFMSGGSIVFNTHSGTKHEIGTPIWNSGGALWNSAWNHFAFVRTGSLKQIWVDGLLKSSGAETNGPYVLTNGSPMLIGSGLTGVLDEWVFRNVALTGSDVRSASNGFIISQRITNP